MPAVKCLSCPHLENSSSQSETFFCGKMQHEMENGYAMAFHAKVCDLIQKTDVHPSKGIATQEPTILENHMVVAPIRSRKNVHFNSR